MPGREQSGDWDGTGNQEPHRGSQPQATGDKQSALRPEGQVSTKGAGRSAHQ